MLQELCLPRPVKRNGGWVRSDDFGGGRGAAHHLVDAGGTRFAMLGGEGHLPSTKERREGFLAGLSDRGFAADDVLIIGENDLLLCGFDGVGWTRQISPTITTVRQDWGEIAARAMEILDTLMSGGDGDRAVIPVELVPGESTRR